MLRIRGPVTSGTLRTVIFASIDLELCISFLGTLDALRLPGYTQQLVRISHHAKGLCPDICFAELHQLASPETAHAFLDSLLASSSKLHTSVEEVGLFGGYVMKSWQGIIRSSGIF